MPVSSVVEWNITVTYYPDAEGEEAVKEANEALDDLINKNPGFDYLINDESVNTD